MSSYPTYEEWKPPRNFCASSRLLNPVLILPMRNGNLQMKDGIPIHFLRSYPTYEEWKHDNEILL